MLNAAVNYTEHGAEIGRPAAGAPAAAPPRHPPDGAGHLGAAARRPAPEPVPFLKPRTALIADGETIRLPPGRERIDWECELAVVIGRRATRAHREGRRAHLRLHAGERRLRPRRTRGLAPRLGLADRQAHDTFAPLGPVHRAQGVRPGSPQARHPFLLSGTLMQDSSTERMTHTVYELVHYASNILTLRPGDVISTGSPAGVGSARNPPIFMKPGDVAVCTIEGIGTLTNPVAAATTETAAAAGSPTPGAAGGPAQSGDDAATLREEVHRSRSCCSPR